MSRVTHRLLATLVAIGALAPVAQGSPSGVVPTPLATVVHRGGLCLERRPCRTTFRIGDSVVSGEGYRSRPLKASERRALVRAIAKLDRRSIVAHPFRGTCPTALDGRESVYRFRGFALTLPSCTYDLDEVEAVRLAARIVASLRYRGR